MTSTYLEQIVKTGDVSSGDILYEWKLIIKVIYWPTKYHSLFLPNMLFMISLNYSLIYAFFKSILFAGLTYEAINIIDLLHKCAQIIESQENHS